MRDDLPPGTDPGEVRELAALAERLLGERPLPSPSFRGRLGRRLAGGEGPPAGVVLLPPRRALALSGAYSFAGLLLLAVAAAGLAGAGPFAPG